MVIQYPAKVKCPKCDNSIKIDYSYDVGETSDLLSIGVEMPQSTRSGSDSRQNKQSIGLVGHYLIVCQHCFTIIGIIPGDDYLYKNSRT